MLKQFKPALATIGAAVITIVTAATANAVIVNPVYQVDDGTTDGTIGLNDCGSVTSGQVLGDLTWLNEFNTEPNGDWIKSVSISWGMPAVNPCLDQPLVSIDAQPAKLSLYQFDEATETLDLLTQVETTAKALGTDVFDTIDFDRPTQVKGRFFIGALLPNQVAGQFPAAFDTGALKGQSWLGFNSRFALPGTPQPTFDGSFPLNTISKFEGNWLLRANSTKNPNPPVQSVPESNPAIGLLAIGALGTGAVLRRKLRKNN
ncbi:hypothetical protein ACKFKG_16555 [Phormidesmis sp. 146-35]